jgi:hypothetical protein
MKAVAIGSAETDADPRPHGRRAVGYTVNTDAPSLLAMVGRPPEVATRVREFSPEHVVVQWTAKQLIPVEQAVPVSICVASGRRIAFDALLCGSSGPSRSGALLLRTVAPSKQTARELICLGNELLRYRYASLHTSGRAAVREVIEADERKREILSMLARYGSHGIIRLDDFPIGTARLVEDGENSVAWEIRGPDVVAPVHVEFYGYNSIFILEFDEGDCRGGSFAPVLPTRITRLRNRIYRRAPAPRGISVQFTHPLWSDLHVDRGLREISVHGLSFSTKPAEDLLYPGLVIEQAVLSVAGRRVQFSAEVKLPAGASSDGHQYCGLRIFPASAKDESVWRSIVEQHLHPTTRRSTSWSAMWQLYEKAGYFNLSDKTPNSFDELARSFTSTSKQLLRAPEIGCHIVWDEGNTRSDVQAAMSMLKVYTRAWIVFQLAKVSGPTREGAASRAVLRDLHVRCYEHAQRDPDLRWLIGIIQVKPVWSRAVHYDLPERYVAMGKAAIVRFRAMQFPSLSTAYKPPEGLSVDRATTKEIALLLTAISHIRPSAYREALDLVQDRFDLTGVAAAWRIHGLDRRREVLVARDGHRTLAAAIVESADNGLHLFGLFDSVRLFALSSDGERAYAALLAAAQRWYGTIGKGHFVAFLEDGVNVQARSLVGAEDLGLADFVALSSEHLPELLEHVYEITAPRAESGTRVRATADGRGHVA